MFQVGWCSASRTVTLRQLCRGVVAERAAAGRQDDAFQFVPPTRLQGLEDGTVFAVHGQQLGVACGRRAARSAARRRPGFPCWPRPRSCRPRRAAQVPRNPALPTMADSTMSTSGSATTREIASGPISSSTPRRQVVEVQRRLAAAASSENQPARPHEPRLLSQQFALRQAVKARAGRAPPEAAITSSALRPILPVEPRTTTDLARQQVPRDAAGYGLSDKRCPYIQCVPRPRGRGMR